MNIIISVFVLSVLFVLYKNTYFFNQKRHKIFQYGLIVFLASLALVDVAIGNKILKEVGFSFTVGLNFILALLVFFTSLKVMK